ncbi:MAG: hypothetical protein WCN87_02740 [Chlamydiota bacterium]
MKKALLTLLLSGVFLQAQTAGVTSTGSEPPPNRVYNSYTSECSGKGAARAAGAGNRCGITSAQIAAGVLVGAFVTLIATIVVDNAHSHSS